MITYIQHKIQRLSRMLSWILFLFLIVKAVKTLLWMKDFIQDYHWDTAFEKIIKEHKKNRKPEKKVGL